MREGGGYVGELLADELDAAGWKGSVQVLDVFGGVDGYGCEGYAELTAIWKRWLGENGKLLLM
jgi:hypothetical protein